MIKQYYGIAASVCLLGLFPVFFLKVLQVVLLLMLIGLVFAFRRIDRAVFKQLLTWRYIVFAQFYIYFFLNAAFYPVKEGVWENARAVALESWSTGLLCLIILALWLQVQNRADVKRALISWLPIGLTISFLTATIIYLSGAQGPRVELFTPTSLAPPFWFLVLTMTSFAWFFEMSTGHKVWRLCLFFMAGIMVIYGGARLVMLAWILCAMSLAVWFYIRSARANRPKVLMGTTLAMAFGMGGVFLVDALAGGPLVGRVVILYQAVLNGDSTGSQFLRLRIWDAALTVIADNPTLGIGKANERIALRQELEWDRWLRAHQTYLSYLIAGGIPALMSGLVMQSSAVTFLNRANRSALFPAFLGLGVVLTLNCLTDSIFQSAVAVQIFMLITLLFLRASDAGQPTLVPQKHISPAIM